MYFGFYTCITELIHVFQILYMSYRVYTCVTGLILVLQILYGAYSCLSDLIRSLFLSFGYYTCLTDLILVLRNWFLYFRSYSFAKVPVSTISRNKSDLYRYISGRDISS